MTSNAGSRGGSGGPNLRRSLGQRPQCYVHGLATGPDGACTLCKRSSQPAPPNETVSPLARFVTSVLGVLALATAGVALAAALGWIEVDGLAPAWLRPEPAVVAKPEPRLPSAGQAPPPAPKKTEAQLIAERVAQQITEQSQMLAASSPSPDELERNLQAKVTADETAKRDRERRAEIEADMAARSLKRAREKVDIVMYSTSWCPVCTEARDYMKSKSIRFIEHDVEQSPSAKAIQRRLNPKGSIPTIDVEGAVLVGFSDESLEQLIDAAAQKHVR